MRGWWAWAILLVWLLAAMTTFWLPEPGSTVELGRALEAPGGEFLAGTDPLGRPLTYLLLGGARTALLIGAVSILLAGTFGVLLGTLAGYLGGWVDALVMRIIDVFLAFPGILLAIAITAVLGPKTEHIILALTLLGWTGFARLSRGQTLSLKSQEYVLAARTAGTSRRRIVTRHLVPNLLAPILVQASFGMAGAILAESSLAFLGLGDPTDPSWGGLLSDGVRYLRSAPWLSIFPGAALFAIVLALNVVGDELGDRLDPRNR